MSPLHRPSRQRTLSEAGRADADARATLCAGEPSSLAERTMRELVALVRDEGLAVGDSLAGENALALRLGVSRTIVREAVKSLAAIGVLDVANGRAPRVAAPDEQAIEILFGHALYTRTADIGQALDIRRTLEARTVVLAAARRSAAQAEAISGHAEAMAAQIDDDAAVMRHDIAFHRAIAEAAGNPFFALILAGFESVTRRTWPEGWRARRTAAERLSLIEIHLEIARAIAARDPAHAERAMARHFDDTLAALARAGAV